MRAPGVATDRKPRLDATLLLIGLTVLRMLVQFVPVPLDLVPTTSLIVSMIFVGLPIDLTKSFCIIGGWMTFFFCVNRWLWNKGLRYYSGMGA
jgi:ABC-type uncharacterized transport system permease subunit